MARLHAGDENARRGARVQRGDRHAPHAGATAAARPPRCHRAGVGQPGARLPDGAASAADPGGDRGSGTRGSSPRCARTRTWAGCSCAPRRAGRWRSAPAACATWTTTAWRARTRSRGSRPTPPRHLRRTDGFAHVADIMVNSFYDAAARRGLCLRGAHLLPRRHGRLADARLPAVPGAPAVARRAHRRGRAGAPRAARAGGGLLQGPWYVEGRRGAQAAAARPLVRPEPREAVVATAGRRDLRAPQGGRGCSRRGAPRRARRRRVAAGCSSWSRSSPRTRSGVRVRALYLRDPAHAEAAPRLSRPPAGSVGALGRGVVRAHRRGRLHRPPAQPGLLPAVPAARARRGGRRGRLRRRRPHRLAGVLRRRDDRAVQAGARRVRRARGALWSVVFISLFPTALFFQAVYSESLFLLLTLLAFWWARRGAGLSPALAGMLAVLTSSSGLVLLVPLALLWWEQRRGARGAPARRAGSAVSSAPVTRRPAGWSWAWLLLVPAGLGAYMTFLGWRSASRCSSAACRWRGAASSRCPPRPCGAAPCRRCAAAGGWRHRPRPGARLVHALRGAGERRPSRTCWSSPGSPWPSCCSLSAGGS